MAQASTRYARLQGLAIYCDNDKSCKRIGSSTVYDKQVNICPNAINKNRSERVGCYRNDQGGVACLAG